MNVLAGVAEDEELRGVDQEQVDLLLAFLREACVRGEGLNASRHYYVTYDTGKTSLRAAFDAWLRQRGKPAYYGLPPIKSSSSAPLRRLIRLKLHVEPIAEFRHAHHGRIYGAYRGYRLVGIPPEWYHEPFAGVKKRTRRRGGEKWVPFYCWQPKRWRRAGSTSLAHHVSVQGPKGGSRAAARPAAR